MKIKSLINKRIINCSASVILLSGISISGVNASQVDFNIAAPTSGSISYAGGASALTGSNIDVDNIIGLGTPSHDNVISACDACTLNFSTGVLDNFDATTSTWTFLGGGSIEVVGGIDFADNGSISDIPVATSLLRWLRLLELSTGEFQFNIFGGSFSGTQNSDLGSYYGLPGSVEYLGGLNISFSALLNNSGGFNSTQLFSGDIVTAPVPLPAGIWLLISALAVFPFFRRKQVAPSGSQLAFSA